MSTPLDRMADFDLTPEQRQVRSAVREFAEKEILPHVEEYERQAKYPTDLIEKLVPLGLMGPMIPESYGGSFSDVMTYGVICEELARIDWVIASVVSVSNSLVAGSIVCSRRCRKARLSKPGGIGSMMRMVMVPRYFASWRRGQNRPELSATGTTGTPALA